MSKDNDNTIETKNQELQYTIINHRARQELGLTMLQYCVIDSIHNLQNNELYKFWCVMTVEHLAKFLNCSESAVDKALAVGFEKKLLKKPEKTFYHDTRKRTTQKWIDAVIMKKVPIDDVKSTPVDDVKSTPYKDKVFIKTPADFEGKNDLNISSSAEPSFTLSQESKEAIKEEISKVLHEDPSVNRFLHTLNSASQFNILKLEAGSTVSITEMLKYTFDYVKKTGREVKNIAGFVWEGLKNEWEPGDYYTWGLEKLQAGGYE